MDKDFIEIEDHYKNGVVVKRLINGVEYSLGDFPEELPIHQFRDMSIKEFMSVKEAKEKYKDLFEI